jgi:hypothetical protein
VRGRSSIQGSSTRSSRCFASRGTPQSVTLAPAGSEGAAAGLLDFSRGVGVVLGPVVVGTAVGVFAPVFDSTAGYAVMWPVIGIPVLLAGVLLKPLEEEGAEPVLVA